MTSATRLKSNLRTIFSWPLNFSLLVYVLSLPCLLAAQEISGWALVFFLLIYYIFDRANSKPTLELHTTGAEIPLLLFLIVVFAGLKINAPTVNSLGAMSDFGIFVILYALVHAFQIYKNLNQLLFLVSLFGALVCGYVVWQNFSGQNPLAGNPILQDLGHVTSLGHCFIMILCLPWAALLLGNKRNRLTTVLALIACALILFSLALTFNRGVWVSLLVALPLMAFFASRKFFLTSLAVLLIFVGLFYKMSSNFREKIQTLTEETSQSGEDRKNLWHANMEMFRDHPWIGVGYKQNEALLKDYYQKLGIANGPEGNARSNYVEMMASTGILGSTFYLLFAVAFLLMTARLLATIPQTHHWHRVFALAALGAQVAFHIGGLTYWSFGEPSVAHQFIFWLAVVSYMTQRYFVHIVPDDRSI